MDWLYPLSGFVVGALVGLHLIGHREPGPIMNGSGTSSINLAEHDVERPDDCGDVRQHMSSG
jgi:hypothetical protein